jgi:anaerobic selenocysteine-containing dehydrogenase
MIVGTNPVVSLSTFNFDLQNPVLAIKRARARGMKLIVIDPRVSETARFADLHLRPLPGEDATLMAGLLHVILANGWHDHAFCSRHVDGLAALQSAVIPFAPDHVASRSGVSADEIRAAAALFAEPLPDRVKRGTVASGTGPNMGPHSNLAEHLLECINVVCGRYPRAGDAVANPGVVGPRVPRLAQVVPPRRNWETGWRDSHGFGMIFGERMSATLPDAIRSRGDDRVAALIVDGGNPVNSIPGADVADAFAELELLVTIDPFVTETGRLAHYILPPKMMLERADCLNPDYETHILQQPYAQYCEPAIEVPAGSHVVDDWLILWELGRRLGLELKLSGQVLDYIDRPDSEALIELLLANSAVPFGAIREATEGRLFEVDPMFVATGNLDARFSLAPADVIDEIGALFAEQVEVLSPGSFRFAVRRMRDVQNTQYHGLASIRKRVPTNPAWMHPDDLADLDIADGDRVEIRSRHGSLETPAVADRSMRRGVVAMTHGWGHVSGTNVNALTTRSEGHDPINAMPIMTGFSVTVRRAGKNLPR